MSDNVKSCIRCGAETEEVGMGQNWRKCNKCKFEWEIWKNVLSYCYGKTRDWTTAPEGCLAVFGGVKA